MLTDEWRGMRVYCSMTVKPGIKRGLILDNPLKELKTKPQELTEMYCRKDRCEKGKSLCFLFYHPGRERI